MKNLHLNWYSRVPAVSAPSAAVATVALILLITSSCLSFFQHGPRYIEGTSIQIRRTAQGEDYSVRLGESKTTTVEAILSGSGEYSVAYSYKDIYPLRVNRLVFETYCCLSSVETRNPHREDFENGEVYEYEGFPVQQQLFSQMLETDTPIIFIEGENGSVIIKMGDTGKEHLKELLDFGSEMFE
jgi:hypothetical protein